jgi:hypothetical protein
VLGAFADISWWETALLHACWSWLAAAVNAAELIQHVDGCRLLLVPVVNRPAACSSAGGWVAGCMYVSGVHDSWCTGKAVLLMFVMTKRYCKQYRCTDTQYHCTDMQHCCDTWLYCQAVLPGLGRHGLGFL